MGEHGAAAPPARNISHPNLSLSAGENVRLNTSTRSGRPYGGGPQVL